MAQGNNLFFSLLVLGLAVVCHSSLAGTRRLFFGVNREYEPKLGDNSQGLLKRFPRGGSTLEATEEDGEDEAGPADEDEDNEEEDEDMVPSVMSSQPVRLMIQTNLGNSVLDERIELMAARTRNVVSLKKSVSRQLPGRPPVLGLDLVFEGRVLEDEMLVDELFDDEEEEYEEDEEDNEAVKVLLLNSIPPVDPKFATELAPKLKAHVEDDDETLSTEELLEAYYLNQATMARNAQLLSDPNTPSTALLRLEIKEQARELREQLKSQVPEDVWHSSLAPVRKSHHAEERKGQRYRSGKGGAQTNLKKSIQHNMNIHWGETIRNCLLFLFFGYFGGRNSLSRYLMLWGAPLCFVLQARPVKMWSKILFYMMVNPPGIVLSLLPAPQQAILSMDIKKSYAALYSTEAENVAAFSGVAEEVEDEDVEEEQELGVDDESEDEESEDESEDESEEESEEESDDDY